MTFNISNGNQNNFEIHLHLGDNNFGQNQNGFQTGQNLSPFSKFMDLAKEALDALQMATQPPPPPANQNPAQAFAAALFATLAMSMLGNPRYGQMGAGTPDSRQNLANLMEGLAGALEGFAGGIGDLQALLGQQGGGRVPSGALPFLPAPPMFGGAGGIGTGFGNTVGGGSQMTDGKAIRTLLDNFDKLQSNGVIGKPELEKAAQDSSNPELAAAARHVLDNQALMDGLDTAYKNKEKGKDRTDGLISKNDLQTARDQSSAEPTTGMDHDKAMNTLLKNWDNVAGSDGMVSKDDLAKAAKDTKNPELAKAANFMLDNKTFLDGLDTAFQHSQGKKRSADGEISREDMATALQSSKFTPQEAKVLNTLGNLKDTLFGNGNMLSLDQIRSMAKGGNMPDGKSTPLAVQLAMQSLLNSPGLLHRLDSSKVDGLISRENLDKTLADLGAKGTKGGSAFDPASLFGGSSLPGFDKLFSQAGIGGGSSGQSQSDLLFGGSFFMALRQNMQSSGRDGAFGALLSAAFSQFQGARS